MKLFLASQIKHPASMMAVDNFVEGLAGKNIAYIPTAANAEVGYGGWKNGGTYKAVHSVNANVKTIILEEYRSSKVISELEKADIIWMGGGFWGYLMYWIRLCEIDRHIKDILDSGIIYVGTSAGSNIVSQNLELADWYYGGGERDGSRFPGLGLVDFDLYPHYEDSHYENIKKHYMGKMIYLLKDGESIAVEGDDIDIQGEIRIINN